MTAGSARNLWMGFGALIALLVISSVVIVWRVSAIDGQVREMADARNLGAAAADLESAALAYVLHIRTYLQTGDENALELSREALAAVDENLLAYRQLTIRDGRHDLVSRFEPLWQEIVVLGNALASPENDRVSQVQSQRFFEMHRNLRTILRSEIRQEALRIYNLRKDQALRDVQNVMHLALIMIAAGSAIGLMVSVAMAQRIVRAERHLSSQRELLQVTLASIADAVITTDERGAVTYLNDVAAALTEWSPADALDQPLDRVYRIDRDASASQQLPERAEISLVTRSGRAVPIDESTSPIRDDQGNVVGAVVVFRDATHRRRIEQELRSQAAALAQSNQRKSEFLAMLAHELRNPLAPIRSGAEILQRKTEALPTLKPVVAIIERQVAQLVRLVDDLVDMTRISRGKIELRKQVCELYVALQVAVEEVTPLLESNDQDLRVVLAPHPVIVEGDPERLAQMFGNLLHNAAKFTPHRGRIELKVTTTSHEVVVQISDNGIGIDIEHLPHVFDLYMQAGTSLQRSGSGVGIGLALVKSICELHGGTVQARSEGVGQGSTFIVRLPRSVKPVADVRTVATSPVSPMRILVVDDNWDAAEAVAALLRSDGHEVDTAPEGTTALEMAERWRPQVVLLDLGMPGMDGFQIAKAIRASAWGRGMRLIALTGWGQPENLSRTRAAGFDGHLVKPANLAALNAALSGAGAYATVGAGAPETQA